MAKLPDGLIFEYELDPKGTKVTCTQRELVTCKHCIYSEQRHNDTGEVIRVCRMYDWVVEDTHFCGYAKNMEMSLTE